MAVVAGFDPPQCTIDFRELPLPSPGRFLGHFLRLHGIHAREAPDPGLVQLDRPTVFLGCLLLGLEFRPQLEQPPAESFELGCVHVAPRRFCVANVVFRT